MWLCNIQLSSLVVELLGHRSDLFFYSHMYQVLTGRECMRLMLCVGLIFLCAAIIPISANGASFNVDQISITSPENLSSGVSIQVSARVLFDSLGEVTFPESDTLQFSTALTEPEWQYTLIVDNHPVQNFTGKMVWYSSVDTISNMYRADLSICL